VHTAVLNFLYVISESRHQKYRFTSKNQMDLPSFSPFPELYEQATRNLEHAILYDYARLLSQTSAQLLLSVAHARNHLRESLDAEILSKLRSSDEDVFIFTLTPPGYEFVVYMLAILSLGAAICPLCEFRDILI
jgi:hypothetical protein